MRITRQLIDRLKPLNGFVVWGAQVAIFAISGAAAFLLRFDFRIPSGYRSALACALPVWIAAKSLFFRAARLDRGWWRYVSVADIRGILLGNIAGSLLGWASMLLAGRSGFPRSIYLLDLMICFLGTAGVRVLVRLGAEPASVPAAAAKNILIYGAGDAGVILLREVQHNPKLSYRVRGFVDDRADKRGARILGVPVLGSGADVAALAPKFAIEAILIAIPSATGAQMTRILESCQSARVPCKTVPGLGEIIGNRALAGQIREVAVQDLLGRNLVRLEQETIRQTLEGKLVLVTGAGGSIGSELCRQIGRLRPARIVGLDIAESPLFEIDREMQAAFPAIPFSPEIGSIQNRERLQEVFRRYRPFAVFHAAAYKHVPLMETHVFEAVENNVFGTYNVAQAAAESGVDEFVLISSDKAVRPTSIMGATKRLAELLLMDLDAPTKFVAVRFGNVLGSNGSIIPIFKKQIAAGGPVTVTHPEMRRFFMTIPEACQLVLEAGAIGKSGQICVLNMGESVKIVDLARKLILLSGLRPDEEIKIEFSGIRPGEKLSEELHSILEDAVPTAHEKIRIFTGNRAPEGGIEPHLASLREICQLRDAGRLLVALKELVPEYSPSTYLLKRVVEPEGRRAEATYRRRMTVYSRREFAATASCKRPLSR